MRRIVALCITDLDVGGAERCLTELAVRVDRGRFEPVVYCLGPRPPNDAASCVPRLLDAGVETHFLGARRTWEFPLVVRRLKQRFRKRAPDLVQTFLFHANVVGRLAARGADIQAVVAGVRVAERAARWHLLLDRWTQRWVNAYVCVSQAVAEFSAAEAGLPREKLHVIPNGIDLEKYPARRPADLREFGVAPGRRAAVFVGRLEPQKGVEWLVESAPQWLQQTKDCDLLLVGGGPLLARLSEMALRAGVADRVHFAGWRPDVPEILAAAALVVLPSAWEGMPNVVLEAMASGRAVVATDVEGVRELLGSEAGGQTVAFGDSAALAEKITRFLCDPARAAAAGNANRRRAEEHFDIARIVRAYEQLWESLLR